MNIKNGSGGVSTSVKLTEIGIFSGLISFSFLSVWTFFLILTTGRAAFAEPNLPIAYSEFVFAVWTLVFGFVFIVKRLRDLKKEGEEVSV